MVGGVLEEKFASRAGARMLLEIAAALDYRGMYELAIEGIPAMPPAPPGSLPSPEELAEQQERELAEFRAAREEESEQERLAEANRKYTLTPLGLDKARCLQALKRWLGERPGGPPPPERLVRDALGPLLCGWSGTIVHALAPEPATLDELDRAVTPLDREELHEHIGRMARSGIAAVEAEAGSGPARYALTDWGRAAIGPIVAAVHYERRHDEELTLAPDVLDVEAGFQMALPKGSDVNVATHLMKDVFEGSVDGVVIVSNDSDLKLPIAVARDRVPVGLVTPTDQHLAGDLAFASDDGVGSHWQVSLTAQDFKAHQLPDPVGPVSKPDGW